MELTDLYLKPEEITKLHKEWLHNIGTLGFSDYIAKASANHAVKKVVEWGNEECGNTEHLLPILKRRNCIECWQELEELDKDIKG